MTLVPAICSTSNQTFPSGPATMSVAWVLSGRSPGGTVGTGGGRVMEKSAIWPLAGARRPTPVPVLVMYVNQRLPSVPAVMPGKAAPGLPGTGKSLVTPDGDMRPITSTGPLDMPPAAPTNQRLPSGPVVTWKVPSTPRARYTEMAAEETAGDWRRRNPGARELRWSRRRPWLEAEGLPGPTHGRD